MTISHSFFSNIWLGCSNQPAGECVYPFSREGGINLFGDHGGSILSNRVVLPFCNYWFWYSALDPAIVQDIDPAIDPAMDPALY